MIAKATCLLLASLYVSFAAAQTSSQQPVKGMASTVGLYVYPQKQQTATQQLTDEQQCYGSAKTQTGFDPNAPTTVSKTAKPDSANDHAAAKGALRGAPPRVPWAEIRGREPPEAQFLDQPEPSANRKSRLSRQTSRRPQRKLQQQQKQDDFKRAMSACLDARGYSVR